MEGPLLFLLLYLTHTLSLSDLLDPFEEGEEDVLVGAGRLDYLVQKPHRAPHHRRLFGIRCRSLGCMIPGLILHENKIKLKLSGNEVYYTARSLLVILENSCGKLHCQKVVIQFRLHMRLSKRGLARAKGATVRQCRFRAKR